MDHKRHPLTRFRSKRTRPKTPAPQTGWVMAELARLTEISPRRRRHFLEHRLIAPTEFRGTATSYHRRELMCALSVEILRAKTGATIAEIKRTLDTYTGEKLEQWVSTKPVPAGAAAALKTSRNVEAMMIAPRHRPLTPQQDA